MVESAAQSKTRRSTWIQLGISTAVTIVFAFLLIHEQSEVSFFSILRQTDQRGIWCYITLSMLGVIVRALRTKLMLQVLVGEKECPSTGTLFLISSVRNALVDLVPARLGEAGYVYLLNRAGIKTATGISTFGFAIFLDLVVLTIMLLALGVAAPLFSESLPSQLTAHPLLLISIAAAIFVVLRSLMARLPRWLRKLSALERTIDSETAPRHPKIHRSLQWLYSNTDGVADDLEKLLPRGNLTLLVGYTLALRVLKYTALYVLLLSVLSQYSISHNQLQPGLTMLAFVMAEGSASLPISGFMGFGAYESALSFVLSLSHIEVPSLIQVSFAVHLITQVKAYSLAFLAMLLLLRRELSAHEKIS